MSPEAAGLQKNSRTDTIIDHVNKGVDYSLLRRDFLEAGFLCFVLFFSLFGLGFSCHDTIHLGPVWFDLASCTFFGEHPGQASVFPDSWPPGILLGPNCLLSQYFLVHLHTA